ncbi:MAG: NAD-dependent deacylase [Desulfarculaceae bacterium]|jgi:NAD-dependent deacetylase
MNPHELRAQVDEVADLLVRSSEIMALTGAGISVESGIPAFRGAQGLWERYDPMEYASIQAFRANPAKVWKMLVEMGDLVQNARPNPAHQALARLEELARLRMVVTQNIDGLHQAAGSKSVVEFHGSGRRLRCLDCSRTFSQEEVELEPLPPRCPCGGLIKPDVIFFGESIPDQAARAALSAASICQVMIVAGTSASVAPATHLPILAKQAGGKVVEINLEPTPLTPDISDYFFGQSASQVLPQIALSLEERIST